MSPRVMQHCFGENGSGGPIVAFDRLLNTSKESYSVLIQREAAGGINPALIKRMSCEIREKRPDLIHIRGLGNEGFHAVVAARLARVPNILVSIHGTQRDLVFSKGVRPKIVGYVLEPLTLMLATHIATVCEYAAGRDFIDAHRQKFAGVVSNGVPIPSSIDREKCRAALIRRIDAPTDSVLAICVSRITPEKGYLVLAEAIRNFADKFQNLVVVIAGGGDEDGAIRNVFSSIPGVRVVFLGHLSSVGDVLCGGDFFVFPSLHENLSNALLEAMAYGLPAVASDVGGNSEVLRHGGGLLVPPGEAAPLAEAVEMLVLNEGLRHEMAIAARENIARNYSVDAMVAGWERLYMKILGEV